MAKGRNAGSAPLPPHFTSVEQLFASGAQQPLTQPQSDLTQSHASEHGSAAQQPTWDGRSSTAQACGMGDQPSTPGDVARAVVEQHLPEPQLPHIQASHHHAHTLQEASEHPHTRSDSAASCLTHEEGQGERVQSATSNAQVDDAAPACIVCTEDIAVVAVGSCGHAATCAHCCLRSRLCYSNKRCPVCAAQQSLVTLIPWHPQLPSAPQPTAAGKPSKHLLNQYHYKPSWAEGVLVIKTDKCASEQLPADCCINVVCQAGNTTQE